MLVKPNGLVNFITMFYGFLCMFIMYGAQQYTKAFGMTNCGLTEMQAAGMTSIYTCLLYTSMKDFTMKTS